MRNLEAIKKRINSIETNGKIAFVMKVLSTYKLQTFKKKFLLYQDYLMGFYQIFVNVVNDQQQSFEQLNRLFFPQPINQYQKTLWVIIGSDLGMCGGFNNAIIKKIVPEFAQDDQAYFFGSKTFNISKTYLPNLNLVHLYYQIEKLLDPEHCFWLAKNIFNFFLTNRFQKLKIVYTKFINNITFQPTIIQILPIEKTTFNMLGVLDLNPKITSQEYELSIDPVEMLYELIPQFFSLSLYGGLLESKTSEFSARYQAMSAATDNANNLKNEYKLEYNRVRQALITQEIIEIISGSL